jgi:hypothetical protein
VFFDYYVPGVLKKYKADIFLSPDGWLSLRTNVRSLPVIHDINFFRHPEFIPGNLMKYYKRFFPQLCDKHPALLTVWNSEGMIYQIILPCQKYY